MSVAVQGVQRAGFARIVAVDAAKRIVTLVATSEAKDSFGTIFSYEASKDAFARALGNVREMHQDKAVGNIVRWDADDDKRMITVDVYVSEGAPDTWLKVLDGTLKGGSIGASNVRWSQGPSGVPVAVAYDLVEFSLVDNPSNPDCRIVLVRMVGSEGEHMGAGQGVKRGAVPANALTTPPAGQADVMASATQVTMGKLIVPTSSDPKAPDYGVPPVVGVRGTPFADGQSGGMAMTAASGGFHAGGHATGGASVAEGEQPMPGNAILYPEQHHADGDYDDALPLDPTHDPLRPSNTTPRGQRGPMSVATDEGTLFLVPPGHHLLQDARGRYIVARDGVTRDMGDPMGAELGPTAMDAAPDGASDRPVSPQWHRAAHSALHHAAGIMDLCGCPRCLEMARHARTLRDAFASEAAADGVGDAVAASRRPQVQRRQPAQEQTAQEQRVAPDLPVFQTQVSEAFGQMSAVLAGLVEKVEAIGSQPVAGGPVAMQTRGFQAMSRDDQIRTLTEFSVKSGDPSVQMEAAAAILRLQQGQ